MKHVGKFIAGAITALIVYFVVSFFVGSSVYKSKFGVVWPVSDWSDANDGAEPLPKVLLNNKLATYASDPTLRDLILARLRNIQAVFTEWLQYFKSTNAAKQWNVTSEIGKRMVAARIIMTGHAAFGVPDGTRESRQAIVPPKDNSGFTRLTYAGKLYGFTVDQLYPYSTVTTNVLGKPPAETVDESISKMLYRCKDSGKNCGVVEPVRCDVYNQPDSVSVASQVEIDQCDTTTIYSLYEQLQKEYDIYMQRVKGYTTGVANDMKSSWCATTTTLHSTAVGGEVMLCPSTHTRFSTNVNKCVKNDVSLKDGDNNYPKPLSGCRTGYRSVGSTCVLNEDSIRYPCAKYYLSTSMVGGQVYTPDQNMSDGMAWSKSGWATKYTPVSKPGGVKYPGTNIPIWGRA
jgi:hypothetical protein